ncbi:MAG: metalloregulator ArsR/SmtB family transcription factor [Mycobacterium sp.]
MASPAIAIKDLDAMTEVLRVLANPVRLRILEWLGDPDTHFSEWEPIAARAEAGVCVSHIQAKTQLAQSTVSAYMTDMQRAGLVTSTRVGKWTHYRRDDEAVSAFIRLLGDTLTASSVHTPTA